MIHMYVSHVCDSRIYIRTCNHVIAETRHVVLGACTSLKRELQIDLLRRKETCNHVIAETRHVVLGACTSLALQRLILYVIHVCSICIQVVCCICI
jgi:hypothetical protein